MAETEAPQEPCTFADDDPDVLDLMKALEGLQRTDAKMRDRLKDQRVEAPPE